MDSDDDQSSSINELPEYDLKSVPQNIKLEYLVKHDEVPKKKSDKQIDKVIKKYMMEKDILKFYFKKTLEDLIKKYKNPQDTSKEDQEKINNIKVSFIFPQIYKARSIESPIIDDKLLRTLTKEYLKNIVNSYKSLDLTSKEISREYLKIHPLDYNQPYFHRTCEFTPAELEYYKKYEHDFYVNRKKKSDEEELNKKQRLLNDRWAMLERSIKRL
jgi:hypothetical protein